MGKVVIQWLRRPPFAGGGVLASLRAEIRDKRREIRALERRRSLFDRLIGAKRGALARAERELAYLRALFKAARASERGLKLATARARRLARLARSPAVRANQQSMKALLIAEQDPRATGYVHCHYCEARVAVARCHIDHRRPVKRGGRNSRANTVLACAPCNLAKGQASEAAFRRRRGLPPAPPTR